MKRITLAILVVFLCASPVVAQLQIPPGAKTTNESIFQNKGDHYDEYVPYRTYDKQGMNSAIAEVQKQIAVLNILLNMDPSDLTYSFIALNRVSTAMKRVDPTTRKRLNAAAILTGMLQERQARLERLQSFAPLP